MLAEKLFEQLNNDNIINAGGTIKFELLGIKTTIKTKSVVGDVIQDWLTEYMKKNAIEFKFSEHSQKFPDFFLGNELLEVKCFDVKKSPNFDIANFESYCGSLLKSPERLDSYYLIFSYEMNDVDHTVYIRNIWLKKVWEISGPSDGWPIKFQVKKGMIYNIRPNTWYSERTKYKKFTSRKEFVYALAECIKRYPATNHLHKANWLKEVELGYQRLTGNDL